VIWNNVEAEASGAALLFAIAHCKPATAAVEPIGMKNNSAANAEKKERKRTKNPDNITSYGFHP